MFAIVRNATTRNTSVIFFLSSKREPNAMKPTISTTRKMLWGSLWYLQSARRRKRAEGQFRARRIYGESISRALCFVSLPVCLFMFVREPKREPERARERIHLPNEHPPTETLQGTVDLIPSDSLWATVKSRVQLESRHTMLFPVVHKANKLLKMRCCWFLLHVMLDANFPVK